MEGVKWKIPDYALITRDERASNGKRVVDTWLPIHSWTVAQVWERIKASGAEFSMPAADWVANDPSFWDSKAQKK